LRGRPLPAALVRAFRGQARNHRTVAGQRPLRADARADDRPRHRLRPAPLVVAQRADHRPHDPGRSQSPRRGLTMGARRALLISENAPVPSDRRVWSEARALRDAGWEVTIVCAQGAAREREPFEVVDGVEIRRYRLDPATGGVVAYGREYAQALA